MKMDRTSWIGLIICAIMMVLAFTIFAPDPPPPRPPKPEITETPAPGTGDGTGENADPTSPTSPTPKIDPGEPEQFVTLSSEEVDFVLSTHGGGISSAVMQHHYLTLKDKKRAEGRS